MPKMTGAKFIAETLHAYGVTHFFFMPVVIPDAMPHMERLGIKRIMAHAEKPAAYMADGYARISKKVAVCGAQSVGGMNLAAGIQDELGKLLTVPNRGVKQAGFYVLSGASMPCVLFEGGFISNPSEEKNLKSPSYRKKIAQGVYKAIIKFKSSREKVLAEE